MKLNTRRDSVFDGKTVRINPNVLPRGEGIGSAPRRASDPSQFDGLFREDRLESVVFIFELLESIRVVNLFAQPAKIRLRRAIGVQEP